MKDLLIKQNRLLKELVEIQIRLIYDNGSLKYPPSKVMNDITRKAELESAIDEIEKKIEEGQGIPEITDEEIKHFALRFTANEDMLYEIEIFEAGAKWYREQLKSKQ